MTEKEIREIRMEKGSSQFTTVFIINFEREWGRVTRRIRRSGADLSIPIVRK